MRYIALHSGHDMNISLFEDGRCVYHLELERLYNTKHYGSFHAANNGYNLHENLLPTLFDHVLPANNWHLDTVEAICVDTIQWLMHLYPDKTLRECMARLHYSTSPDRPYDRGMALYKGRDRTFCVLMHHLAHEAYAYYTSPFDDALVFAYDGLGEFDLNTTWAVGEGHRLRHLGDFTHRLPPGVEPNSIGFVYSLLGCVFTFLYGNTHDAPGKAMGLSSFGHPVDSWRAGVRAYLRGYVRQFFDLISLPSSLGISAHDLNDSHSQVARDLMATIQDEAELYMVETIAALVAATGKRDLCLVGGCALNVQINSRLLEEGVVDRLHIPPACSDTGLAMGGGMLYWHEVLGHPHTPKAYHSPYLGDPLLGMDLLNVEGLQVQEYPEDFTLCRKVAKLLAAGRTVGWAQGRSEVGPRALGNRSILADPRRDDMKDAINRDIKHRDYWRPFAPVCIAERAAEWFEIEGESPFMLLSPRVRPDKLGKIPAVTHVDGTARIQTVRREQNPLLYALLRAFETETGVPMLLNTSLNDKGCPIANDGNVILNLLRSSGLQVAVLGHKVYSKDCDRGA